MLRKTMKDQLALVAEQSQTYIFADGQISLGDE